MFNTSFILYFYEVVNKNKNKMTFGLHIFYIYDQWFFCFIWYGFYSWYFEKLFQITTRLKIIRIWLQSLIIYSFNNKYVYISGYGNTMRCVWCSYFNASLIRFLINRLTNNFLFNLKYEFNYFNYRKSYNLKCSFINLYFLRNALFRIFSRYVVICKRNLCCNINSGLIIKFMASSNYL